MLRNDKLTKVARCLIILLMVVLAGVGCTDNSKQPTAPTEKAVETQPGVKADKMVVTLYFATKDGAALVAEKREVSKSDQPVQTALEELIVGPRTAELVKVLPDTSKVRKISIVDHVAYIDFNDAFVKDHWGGSAGEILTISAVVNTVTEFPEIRSVQFMTEGKRMDTLKGHLDLSEPMVRHNAIIRR